MLQTPSPGPTTSFTASVTSSACAGTVSDYIEHPPPPPPQLHQYTVLFLDHHLSSPSPHSYLPPSLLLHPPSLLPPLPSHPALLLTSPPQVTLTVNVILHDIDDNPPVPVSLIPPQITNITSVRMLYVLLASHMTSLPF